MFSRKIIQKNIDRIEAETGIRLVENTEEQSKKVFDHFQAMQQTDGKRSWYQREGQTEAEFDFVQWEKDWIRNELTYCAVSFPYWFYRYFFLKTVDGRIFRPEKQVAQSILLDILSEIDEKQLPIILFLLKGRQLGISTIVEAIIMWIAMYRRGSHTVIASAEETKSVDMSNMVWNALDNLPLWMMPTLTGESRSQGPIFGHQGSRIQIQHGAQRKGISQGATPIAAHICLAPNTLIQLTDGKLWPIHAVPAGSEIVTHTGKTAKIKQIWKSHRTHEIGRRIWIHGTYAPLDCTIDHPVRVVDEWKEAYELQRNDWVFRPVREITHELKQATFPPNTNYKRSSNKSKIENFEYTFDTGYACGLYLAEGTIRWNKNKYGNFPAGIQYTIHAKEIEEVQKRIMAAFGMETLSHRRTTSKTATVMIYWSALGRWMAEEFGRTDGKRVPAWAWQAGREFCRGIVRGYLDGDGHYLPDGTEVFATSTRETIPTSLREMVASLGYGWSSIHYRESGEFYRRNCKAAWTWQIASRTAYELRKDLGLPCVEPTKDPDHWRWAELGGLELQVESVGHSWLPVVYDLEVDHVDHSFLTPSCCVKNSEVAYFDNPSDTIERGLIRAMHENPRTFLALESTAKTKDDWFHTTWKYNREMEATGMNRYTCLFLPWYVGIDKYPTKDFMRNHPTPDTWEPLKITIEQASKARLYVRSQPLLRKYLGEKWEMGRDQMWFWEFNYFEAARSEQTLRNFYSELAADEFTCFQSKKGYAFAHDVLDRLKKEVEEAPQYTDYAITGSGIDQRYYLSAYHDTKPGISINFETIEGEQREWKLIPLKSTPRDETESFFLRIWEHPKRGYTYTIPGDTGAGVGKDRTCMGVMRVGRGGEPDVMVALLLSAWLPAIESPPFFHALGIYYGKMMEPIQEAYLCPETQLGAGGDPIVHQLNKEGYSSIHRMRRYDMAPRGGGMPNRLGWATTAWSRPLITQTMQVALRNGWVRFYDERILEEIENLEMYEDDSGGVYIDHSSSSHDDAWMTMCIGHWCSHDEETLSARKAGRLPSKSATTQPKEPETWTSEQMMSRQIMLEERSSRWSEEDEQESDYVY